MNQNTGNKATLTLDGPYGMYTLELEEYELHKSGGYGESPQITKFSATSTKDMKYTSKSASPFASAAAHVNCKCSPTTLLYKNDCLICKRDRELGKQPIQMHPVRIFQDNRNLCLGHYAAYAEYLKSKDLICSDNSSDKDDDD